MLATNSPADPRRETTSVWSMEHFRRYQSLLRQAQVTQVFENGPEVRLQLAGPSSTGKRYRVAVTWSDTPPGSLIESVDDFHKLAPQVDHAYRALGNGWFLWIGK